MVVFAQPKEIRFRHITIVEGLSQSSPRSIIQDRHGFIWIGTTDGLNRYDGYKFEVFKAQDNTTIFTMFEDTNNVLWLGTEASGLKIFNPSTGMFTRYLHNPTDSNSINNNRISVLYKDSTHTIWVGTENGLSRFDRNKNQFIHYRAVSGNTQSLSNNSVQAICQDRSGILWIGTKSGGLNAFDPIKEQFTWYKNIPEDSTSISSNNVLSICQDIKGILWIGTSGGGLNRLDPATNKFSRYLNNPDDPCSLSDNYVTHIYEDKSRVLWIGTENKGLCIFDRRKNVFFRYQNTQENPSSLSTNRIQAICEDADDNLWFGTRGGGINLYTKEAQKFAHYKPVYTDTASLSYKMVWEIFEDSQGIIWIGTDGGGLNRFDREQNKFTFFKHDPKNPNSLSDNNIYVVHEDTKGMLWIGTRLGGLVCYDRKKGHFTNYRFNQEDSTSISCDWVMCLLEDRRGNFWIGTNGGGVNKFDRLRGTFKRYTFNQKDSANLWGDRIRFLIESRSGALWIGTLGAGLNEFDPITKAVRHYTFDTNNTLSLSSDYLASICEDHAGTIWVGTYSGISRLDMQKKSFTRFTTENGLPDNMIYDILEDNSGYLWISTNRGLSKFNPRTGEIRNFDEKDGLQSNEFNRGAACKSRTGELYFGGINGFNRFYPDSIICNTTVPRVVITDFSIFNKSVPVGPLKHGRTILQKPIYETNRIVLTHRENVFSFEFAALHFVSPEKNQYAYKMEGFDKEWNYSGHRRFATYTNLDPGIYTFRVKASNNDGLWNEKGIALTITILPPFWKTWWFILLACLLITTIIVAICFVQINRLKAKKEEEDRTRILTYVNHLLEQGTAVIYHRKFNSNTFDFIGEKIIDITGYSSKEITMELWYKIVQKEETFDPFAHSTMHDLLQRAQNKELDHWVAEYQIKTKSGELRWVRDFITVLFDKHGNVLTLLGAMFDITDRKLAEEMLAATSNELNMKNQEMEQDLNMAREIQTSFLEKYPPVFPAVPIQGRYTLEFSHLYVPALKLAGDIFEIIPISEHLVSVLICDVIGHGTRASLLAFYIRGLIAELMPVAHDPPKLLKKLNLGLNSIIGKVSPGFFASVFYLVADTKTGELIYSNAGHPVPFMLRRDKGTVESLMSIEKAASPAIGLDLEHDYPVNRSVITHNDTLFFFTDGAYEVWNSEKDMLGIANLKSLLENRLHTTVPELLKQVMVDIMEYSNTRALNDDICMVAMHCMREKVTE
jgi:PAS domain S-box-containing protein